MAAARPGRWWLLPLALLPGLLLALLLTLPERVTGQEVPAGWIMAEVNGEHRFSQSFVPERDRLAGVRLYLFRSGSGAEYDEQPVTVRLRTTTRPGPDLASASLPLRELRRDGPTEFAFPPFSPVFPADVLSTTLYLEVEAPGLPPGSGLMIAGSSSNDEGGLLRIDGKRFSGFDMAFTLLYEPLLADRFVPLSRLAQGRPGFMGWPPLYLLLAYSYLLLAGLALWTFWRRLWHQNTPLPLL